MTLFFYFKSLKVLGKMSFTKFNILSMKHCEQTRKNMKTRRLEAESLLTNGKDLIFFHWKS